jgi:chromosome segregation ATPase
VVGARLGDQVARTDERSAELVGSVDRLQESVDRLQLTADDLAGTLAMLRRDIQDVVDTVSVQIDVSNQVTELHGRLLQASASRIESLEEALAGAAARRLAPSDGAEGSASS